MSTALCVSATAAIAAALPRAGTATVLTFILERVGRTRVVSMFVSSQLLRAKTCGAGQVVMLFSLSEGADGATDGRLTTVSAA